ncbi:zinc finger and BTB domain-containing protein 11 [Solea senegalensis]|uniref:Zinc finger and BTB domain-containing protein 11 n=1 Tax=Solea senegalensis TaxID=28829 RepID=A0AAV6SCF9_SOLSE|nr:zinc finger and BTB domain-containing protein 11 [Solea senegalensis]KAG7514670.1 zinc finger and BTB domain-containing protein 11 [Solea senegalensis]
MSCEESYLAIIRYLTDEREPYAPGTPGNTKRKIRKAAACYVVRNGTLFYQRRLKGQNDFTELEVVLQDGRRKELINQAHITEEGEHLNQQLTWECISQKYWWRGIQKHVKDYIRECTQCLSRRTTDDGSGPRLYSQGRRHKGNANMNEEDEDEEEEDAEDALVFSDSSSHLRSKLSKTPAKHELVFVDSKGEVNQFLPKHGQTILGKLNQQRLSNQFCDITLLIEGEEYRAHKAVLAACSEYFHELFFEKGAATTHEAVVDLSGFTKASFLPLLDFAYTSMLTFNFCYMAEIASLARHLLMTEVLQICESVHKQVEEQKLTVYQRGDVHTVVSSQLAPEEGAKDESGAYVVAIETDDSGVVTHSAVAVSGESLAFVTPSKEAYIEQPLAVVTEAIEESKVQGGEAGDGETVTLIAHGGHAESGETVTLISRSEEGAEGETMTVVTHSGQAGASESLAMVSACLAMEQPQVAEAEAFVLNVEADKVNPSEVIKLAAEAAILTPETVDSAPTPQKRKRGRPAKAKKEVEFEEYVPMEEEDPSANEGLADKQGAASDDPNKRRLRQRSIGEGGYARLHMGLEGEEEVKMSTNLPRATTPKVGPKPGKRGRPPKQPAEIPPEGQSDSGAEPEANAVESMVAAEVITEEAAAKSTEPETEMSHDQLPAESNADGAHTCSECGMSFQRRYSLIMHTLKHEKSRGYKCSLCSKEFQYAASLRAHLARHKQQSSQRTSMAITAAHQSSEAKVDGNLDDKTSSTPTRREFVCDICNKTLPKLYSLRIHMLSHTGVRPHSCKVCGKTFTHKHSLKMHRALHDVTKQFRCEFCLKTFVSKRNMEEHTTLHTGESKYLCNTCGATFHRASALSKHMKKHQPKPDVRPFACAHCDKRFYEAKDLQQHMNKHMGLKPFQCQVCGKCYSWKKDWYSHVKSHSVAEPFKCNVCGKEFFEKALFRRHVKKATHGKKGRIKQNLERECEQCGRKFTQLREYRRHINNHQGVKPFECLTCGVAWADARSLKRHVRTHTGERPYVCPMCQEAHIDARTLRKHMAKYHSDNLPSKIMLEKDTLQFHNQGTQVEHAVSILASDLPPELRPAQQPPAEEIETVLITEETIEAVEAVQAASEGSVATLSDQGIMQVVNYVLAQQALTGTKVEEEEPEVIQTMEVEVAHVAEVE